MNFVSAVEAGVAGLVVSVLIIRELWRRLRIQYEYRWETFAVRGPRGRQLLHIRRTEIRAIEPLSLKDRFFGLGRFKRLARTSFGSLVVIRSTVAHAKPVIVSWEGRPIAGVTPDGYKLRSGETGREG
jgi:hypothetical protein